MSRETQIKAARKRHQCDICREPIETGSPYVKWEFSNAEDNHDFGVFRFHPECHKAWKENPDAFENSEGYFSFDTAPFERGTSRLRGEDDEHADEDEAWLKNYRKKQESEA
jgi:hypothetical protein